MREGSEMLRLRLLPYTLAVVAVTTLGACNQFSKKFLEQHRGRWAVVSRDLDYTESIILSYRNRAQCNETVLKLNLSKRSSMNYLCNKIPNLKVKK